MKPRTSGRKIACPNQESCLLSCLARVGFFQAITPHKSQPLKNHISPLQLFFPTPLYISTQSGNIVVTISPFVSGRRHSLTPVLEMTQQRVACNGICLPFRDGSPSFSPSSSYVDSAPCHLNSQLLELPQRPKVRSTTALWKRRQCSQSCPERLLKKHVSRHQHLLLRGSLAAIIWLKPITRDQQAETVISSSCCH